MAKFVTVDEVKIKIRPGELSADAIARVKKIQKGIADEEVVWLAREDVGNGVPSAEELTSIKKPKKPKKFTKKQLRKLLKQMENNEYELEVLVSKLKKKSEDQGRELDLIKRELADIQAWKKAVSTSLFAPKSAEHQSQQVVPNNNLGNGGIEAETQALVDRSVVKPPMKI